jgi:putative ABC transport system permease protein
MGSLWQDVRYAVRTLALRPGFAIVAVITIALGIGANTSIFSVVNGVLLEPLPLHEPEHLVMPNVVAPTGFDISLSIPNFKDWREKNRSFASFGANARRSRTLTGGDRPEIVGVRLILGDYFETLGVPTALGRWIPSDDTWAGAAPTAVVTHRFWQRHLGGELDALGRTVTLDGEPFTVVGVMPPEFVFPSADTDIFVPMGYFSERMCWDARGCSQGTWAMARLKSGVTMQMAQADMDRVAREIAELEGNEVAVARLETLTHAYVGDIQSQIWILMGAVGFVLLIACANVASLLLARGESRRREVAVRTALGAGQGRVVRQFLTESLVLATAGGVVGVGLALAGVRLLVPSISDNVPSTMAGNIGLDPSVFFFTLGVTGVAGLLFGVVPALRASQSDLTVELKEGGRDTVGRVRQRLRSALVVSEVALSLVLLIGAGLMVQSLRQLQDVDKGFVAENVFTAEISLPALRYDTKESTWGFFEEFLDRIVALPGAKAVSLTNIVPLEGNSWERAIWAEGVPNEPETVNSVLYHMISPAHFEVLEIPIINGRTFDAGDREGTQLVAIIDETMAEKFWPSQDPIGKRVTFETAEESTEENPIRVYRTVVGVAKNVRHYELENPSRVQVYVPIAQSERSWTTAMSILVKTSGDPLAITDLVRRELSSMDSEVPLAQIETLEGYVKGALSSTLVVGSLLTVFSVLALALAAIGLFGLMSYSVAQRLREIGIHMALGASAGDVVRMVAWRGLAITLVGVGVGLFAAYGLTQLMGNMLFQVNPAEPLTYGAFSAFLMAVAVLAAYLPARRATSVDPAIVLREE